MLIGWVLLAPAEKRRNSDETPALKMDFFLTNLSSGEVERFDYKNGDCCALFEQFSFIRNLIKIRPMISQTFLKICSQLFSESHLCTAVYRSKYHKNNKNSMFFCSDKKSLNWFSVVYYIFFLFHQFDGMTRAKCMVHLILFIFLILLNSRFFSTVVFHFLFFVIFWPVGFFSSNPFELSSIDHDCHESHELKEKIESSVN